MSTVGPSPMSLGHLIGLITKNALNALDTWEPFTFITGIHSVLTDSCRSLKDLLNLH